MNVIYAYILVHTYTADIMENRSQRIPSFKLYEWYIPTFLKAIWHAHIHIYCTRYNIYSYWKLSFKLLPCYYCELSLIKLYSTQIIDEKIHDSDFIEVLQCVPRYKSMNKTQSNTFLLFYNTLFVKTSLKFKRDYRFDPAVIVGRFYFTTSGYL